MYGGNRKVFFENLAARVQDLVKAEKLYTRNRLSLDDVADRLEVSRYYVSHAINNYLGKSFITLVNELRIEQAVRLMTQAGTDKQCLTDIACLVGFSDRKCFTRVFRRFTGLTPSKLRKNYKQI